MNYDHTSRQSSSSSHTGNNDDYNLDPIDFNPSLYPTKKRKVIHTDSYNNTTVGSQNSRYNTKMSSSSSRRKSSKSSRSNGGNSWGRSGSSSSINSKAIDEMFDDIALEDDPSVATMEGICKIAEQLNIDPLEDIRILVLLHKLGANEKPGQISRMEWTNGCQKLRTDSIDKFQALLPSLDVGFMENNEFRNFYKFCFQFNRQGTHKTLEKDVVIALVEMTLKDRIEKQRLSSFIEFLNQTKEASYNTITLDQWMSFFDFSKECPDLNDYDEENSAWPVLIDDFVDFATSMQM